MKNQIKDIVCLTHFPVENHVPYDQLKEVLEALLRVVYPDAGIIIFTEGTPNPEGINAIQVKTSLDKAIKDQLETSLKEVFAKKFEISYAGEKKLLNRINAIVKAQQQFARITH